MSIFMSLPKGFKLSKETKNKMSLSKNGKKTKNLCISFGVRGITVSDETKRKIGLANKGKIVSDETKRKIGLANKGRTVSDETKRKLKENNAHYWLGKKRCHLSEEHKRKLSLANKGKKIPQEQLEKVRGKNSWRWIKDRTKLCRISKQGERRTSAYIYWRKQVWLRDDFKCKINNSECNGKIEAHHILSWREYPELRFEINNGITLCHAHHPRFVAEEKRLISYFQELVSVSKLPN